MYHNTVFWTGTLTTLVGCSYHIEHNINKAKVFSSTSKEQITLNTILPNLKSSHAKVTSIHSIISKYKRYIKQCIQAIEDSRSVFNEENFNWSIASFRVALNSNQESFNSGALLSLPTPSALPSLKRTDGPQHLIKQAQQFMLINQWANSHIYLDDLISIKKSLSVEINKVAPKKTVDPRNSFLLYCYKLANVLINHAFNESIRQRKIDIKKAQEQYQAVRCSIEKLYSVEFINSYKRILPKLFKAKWHSSDINAIDKLSTDYLKSIDSKIKSIKQIISSIAYDNNVDLKNRVTNITNILYNIAPMYATIKILLDFSKIASHYRTELIYPNHIKNTLTEHDDWITSKLNEYITQLIKFVLLGDSNAKQAMDRWVEEIIKPIQYIVM